MAFWLALFGLIRLLVQSCECFIKAKAARRVACGGREFRFRLTHVVLQFD
ncbi:hypothetical protein FHW69_001602 [Luteibacter sp. Sphag1AF]|nr:hypothetical protein [Luteibacter sp. Sphag1AF]